MASLADLIAECGGDDGLVPTAQSAHVAPVPVPTAAPALPIVTAGERDTVAGASMLPYKRPAAVHTPRSDELKPPAVGTSWRWRVQRVGGDGAESGPNAIVQAFSLKKGKYMRINCSVHVQRADTQGRYAHYNEPDNAQTVNAFLEQLKNHAVTLEHVEVGKGLVYE